MTTRRVALAAVALAIVLAITACVRQVDLTPPPDGETADAPLDDASHAFPDAAEPVPDASTPVPDASLIVPDASLPDA